MDLIGAIADSTEARALAEAVRAGAPATALGVAGSSTHLLAGALARDTNRPLLLIVAHPGDADEAWEELRSQEFDCHRLPALELVPGETHASLDLFAERLAVLRRLRDASAHAGRVVVAPIHALMQPLPPPGALHRLSRTLTPGQTLDPSDLVRWLDAAGYRRAEAVEEPGEFAVRGGIIDLFAPGAEGGVPARLDFFADEIESIHEFDVESLGSGARLESVELPAADLSLASEDEGGVHLAEYLPPDSVVILSELMELSEQGRGYFERAHEAGAVFGPPAVFARLRERCRSVVEVGRLTSGTEETRRVTLPVRALPSLSRDAHEAVREVAALGSESGVTPVVCCGNEGEAHRFEELREEGGVAEGEVVPLVRYVHRGFVWEGGARPFVLVPYHELLHRYHLRRGAPRLKPGRAMDSFVDFAPGDLVVHAEHGICKFVGLRALKDARGNKRKEPPARLPPVSGRGGEEQEYLVLEFSGRSRLNVPATQIDQVQRYVGGVARPPKLSTLGGRSWRRQKEMVGEAVRELAAELLRVRAAREAMPGIRYPCDTHWQREFEAEFPYEETEDQLSAIGAVKRDMEGERPMDRLVCGDVGFGKTEVAIRAAFKAVEFGRQVGVLVPTTVLAEQHERTFRERFADYPFRIESLSRFKTDAEARKVLGDLRAGRVDVVIGTHRLLSRDVRFADLGLVIVDEEQRFGVEHKERLLKMRLTADVLTLSATPIPRTLHMALLGLRDISSLATPPADRQAVVTEVIPWNETRIRRAIERELAREGQVFYVHNRVHGIRAVAERVRQLVPRARVVTGHGRMSARELERVMLAFLRREADVLVSTTIIESGIDIPTANTMIIEDADRFGLADLHQLRGRVGRYRHRAYSYLLLPRTRTVSGVAKKRLKAIERFSMLGAGFRIAMRDLELRGAGNLLGPEQSGHIAAVGYDMYCRLLDRAVRELKNESVREVSRTTIDIGLAGAIPRVYIPSEKRRMEAYRRIATASSDEELARAERDVTDAYGSPPRALRALLDLADLRIGLSSLGVRALVVREPDVVFRTGAPDAVARALDGARGSVRVLSPEVAGDTMHQVYYRPPRGYLEPETLLRVLKARLGAERAHDPGSPSVAARG